MPLSKFQVCLENFKFLPIIFNFIRKFRAYFANLEKQKKVFFRKCQVSLQNFKFYSQSLKTVQIFSSFFQKLSFLSLFSTSKGDKLRVKLPITPQFYISSAQISVYSDDYAKLSNFKNNFGILIILELPLVLYYNYKIYEDHMRLCSIVYLIKT